MRKSEVSNPGKSNIYDLGKQVSNSFAVTGWAGKAFIRY